MYWSMMHPRRTIVKLGSTTRLFGKDEQADRRDERDGRAGRERERGSEAIPEHTEDQRRRQRADADREVIPPVRRPAPITRRDIGDQRELCSLGEAEEDSIAGE